MVGRRGAREWRWPLTIAVVLAGLVLVGVGLTWPREPGRVSALTTCYNAAGYSLDGMEWELLALINDHRAANGTGPLSPSAPLSRAAQWMSADMANEGTTSHTDSLGRPTWPRLNDCGYTSGGWGENIAWGYGSASSVFTAWKNSPYGHNENMLTSGFTAVGIGRTGVYWSLTLGTKTGGWDGVDGGDPPPTAGATATPTMAPTEPGSGGTPQSTNTPQPTNTPKPTATPTKAWYQSFATGSTRE